MEPTQRKKESNQDEIFAILNFHDTEDIKNYVEVMSSEQFLKRVTEDLKQSSKQTQEKLNSSKERFSSVREGRSPCQNTVVDYLWRWGEHLASSFSLTENYKSRSNRIINIKIIRKKVEDLSKVIEKPVSENYGFQTLRNL